MLKNISQTLKETLKPIIDGNISKQIVPGEDYISVTGKVIDQSDIGKNPRKLTPKECVALQGFPKEFNVDVVSDGQNYKQFGNSVAVPVIKAIAA